MFSDLNFIIGINDEKVIDIDEVHSYLFFIEMNRESSDHEELNHKS